MSIINVIEGWSGKLASGDGVARTATRMFTVATTGAAGDTPVAIQKAYHLGIPRKGDLYPGDSELRCESPVNVASIGLTLWQVSAAYRTPRSAAGTGDQSSPLSKPAVAAWSFSSSDVGIDEDVHGNPLANVNGEPFDPPLTRRQNDPVLTIERNEQVFDYRRAISYMAKGGATNTGTFFSAAPGTARIENITSGGRQYESGVGYDPATYEIHFRKDGWRRRVLSQGFMIRARLVDPGADVPIVGRTDVDDIFIIAARDAKGNPVKEPVLLTRGGFALKANEAAVWESYDIYPSLSFGPLGLQ